MAESDDGWESGACATAGSEGLRAKAKGRKVRSTVRAATMKSSRVTV